LIEEGKVHQDCPNFGYPPICYAAANSDIQMFEYLLSVGAGSHFSFLVVPFILLCLFPYLCFCS
jgi:ankyrin repeat protein